MPDRLKITDRDISDKGSPPGLEAKKAPGYRLIEYISLAVILLGVPFLFITPGLQYSQGVLPHIWNLSHVPLFFAISWVALNRIGSFRKLSPVSIYQAISLIAVSLGIPVEIYQGLGAREFSLEDIFLNWLGGMLAVSFHPVATIVQNWPRRAVRIFLLTLLGWQSYIVPVYCIDYLNTLIRFPVLSDMDSRFEIYRWSGSQLAFRSMAAHGNRVLGSDFGGDNFSNLVFHGLHPNWSGYACLQFRIYSETSDTVALHLRIHDRQHDLDGKHFNDRYNDMLSIEPGWNRYTIDLSAVRNAPETRKMDMSRIQQMIFFTHAIERQVRLYFDDFELTDQSRPDQSCG